MPPALQSEGKEKVEEAPKNGSRNPLVPVPGILRDGLKKSKSRLWAEASHAMESGRTDEAIARFREIVAMDPSDPKARTDLGVALARTGDRAGAVEQYREALRMSPENAGVHYNLGVVLAEQGAEDEAIQHLQAAVKSDAQMTRAHFQLANLLMRRRRYEEAPEEYAAVVRMEPRNGFARLMEAMALVRLGRYGEALGRLEQGLGALPGDRDLTLALARLLAAAPEASMRDGARALELLRKVMSNQSLDLETGQTLAMAMAAVGEFAKAVEIQRYMVGELERAQQFALTKTLKENLALYERRQPCLTPWPPDDPIFEPIPGNLAQPSPDTPSKAEPN